MTRRESKVLAFCRLCGHKLGRRKTGKFDEYTGIPFMENVCLNKTCMLGCFNITGHRYRFFSRCCSLCGDGDSFWDFRGLIY